MLAERVGQRRRSRPGRTAGAAETDWGRSGRRRCGSARLSRTRLGSNPPSSRPSRASRPRPRRRLFTVDDLHDEFRIGPGSPGPGGVFQHTHSVAGRLADRDVAGNDRVEDGLGEIPADLSATSLASSSAGSNIVSTIPPISSRWLSRALVCRHSSMICESPSIAKYSHWIGM